MAALRVRSRPVGGDSEEVWYSNVEVAGRCIVFYGEGRACVNDCGDLVGLPVDHVDVAVVEVGYVDSIVGRVVRDSHIVAGKWDVLHNRVGLSANHGDVASFLDIVEKDIPGDVHVPVHLVVGYREGIFWDLDARSDRIGRWIDDGQAVRPAVGRILERADVEHSIIRVEYNVGS